MRALPRSFIVEGFSCCLQMNQKQFFSRTFILTMERKLWPQIVSRDFSYPAGIAERNRFIRFPIM